MLIIKYIVLYVIDFSYTNLKFHYTLSWGRALHLELGWPEGY